MSDVRAGWRHFWSEHYREIFAGPNSWLDYSNERVHLQTLGAIVESSGSLLDRVCVDLGAGRGQLSRALAALGGKVVAVEANAEQVASNRTLAPEVDWRVGDLLDPELAHGLPEADRMFLVEVLQCVPWRELLGDAFARVRPGGRLVAVLPFGECPIVQRTITKCEGYYSAPDGHDLADGVGRLRGLAVARYRGFHFQQDQRIVPYAMSAWTSSPKWSMPPNRVQVVLEKES